MSLKLHITHISCLPHSIANPCINLIDILINCLASGLGRDAQISLCKHICLCVSSNDILPTFSLFTRFIYVNFIYSIFLVNNRVLKFICNFIVIVLLVTRRIAVRIWEGIMYIHDCMCVAICALLSASKCSL